MRYRIVIDQSLCSGFGSCAELAPDVFEVGAGGVASVRVGESGRPVRRRGRGVVPDGRDHVVEEQAA